MKTVYYNDIESLDITANTIPEIKFYHFENATKLYMGGSTNLRSLDLSNNIHLTVLVLNGTKVTLNKYLTASKIVTNYKVQYGEEEVNLTPVLTLTNMVNTNADAMSLNLHKGLNTHTTLYSYDYGAYVITEEVDGIQQMTSIRYTGSFTVETNVHIPELSTDKYVVSGSYIYIYNDTLDDVLDNVSIDEGYLSINDGVLETRFLESDEEPCESRVIHYARSNYIKDNTTLKYSEGMTFGDMYDSFTLSEGITLEGYSGGVSVTDRNKELDDVSKIKVLLGLEIQEFSLEKVSGAVTPPPVDPEDDVIIDETITITEEEGKPSVLSNIVLGSTIEELESLITTSGTITYLNKNGEEVTMNESDTLYTGLVVKIEVGEEEYEYVVSIKGDVTGTGSSSISDVMRIVDHVLGDNQLQETCYVMAADVNGDTGISISDVMYLVNQILG